VSRFTRALAATTMAVAAAGGGLLIAAASAVPASAAAQGAPHGSHKITMTAHRAHAGHGVGPHVILPCVAKAGSGIRPASCGDQTITCVITAEAPFVTTAINEVNAIAHVDCSAPVTSIAYSQRLESGGTATVDNFTVQGKAGTADLLGATCHTGTWTNTASAFITFPPGFVITGGQNPIHQTTSSLVDTCQPLVGGGGGGGGGGGVGCGAVHAPTLARHPAARHPDFVSCP
jgi:hypothetical protein